jgi:cysteine synthase
MARTRIVDDRENVMGPFDFPTEIDDKSVYRRNVALLGDKGVTLPTFSELANPFSIPETLHANLSSIDADVADPANLFRVHWYNAPDQKGFSRTPVHIVLPESLTGVPAKIVVAIGAHFPMIGAHKVLAAYSCLAPRLVTGRFDPARQRAIWPSTGNYCRGGVAISRILGCRGVAVLPEGMSQERFDWLATWAEDESDIIRTPGTESNVKEIYDKCAELDRDPDNEIVNQFSEFGNYLGHFACTGPALERVFESLREDDPDLSLTGFVAASGSAGTLAAGDYLKDKMGARIAVVEPVECPTLLYNGYGEHNIQGIGDKHIPLIHNVMNTDFVIAVSDAATDGLNVLFNTEQGQRYLAQRIGVPAQTIAGLRYFGLSSICNILASIKLARHLKLGENNVIVTVATDAASMYETEKRATLRKLGWDGVDSDGAAHLYGSYLNAVATDHVMETTQIDRNRMFNLGYYTWVEQQGISLADFERRRDQSFWYGLRDLIETWDQLIIAFNEETRAAAA